jgi:hypothetical protein
MTAKWCKECLEMAVLTHGAPEIINTDQGSQFTSPTFTAYVDSIEQTSFSMDDKGEYLSKTQVLGEVSLAFIGYNLLRCAQILKCPDAFKNLLERNIALFLYQNRLSLSPFESQNCQDEKHAA